MKKGIHILPILWLVFGCVFGVASYCGYRLLLNASNNAKQLTHQVQTQTDTNKQRDTRNKQAVFDPTTIIPVTPEAYAEAQLQVETIVDQWGIGALYIPSAKIQTKVLAGMANQNLMVGVGTYDPQQQFGQGNAVLLAHNIVQGGGALGNVLATHQGDVIYATDFTNVYEYVTRNSGIVDQSKGELLDKPKDEEPPVITLLRCEGGLNTSNRAVVQGTFHKSYPAEAADHAVKQGLGLERAVTEHSDQATNQTARQQAQQEPANQPTTATKAFQAKQPLYSTLEHVAIRCFGLLQAHPILLAISFLAGLWVLLCLEVKTT